MKTKPEDAYVQGMIDATNTILKIVDKVEHDFYNAKPVSILGLHPFVELKRRLETLGK